MGPILALRQQPRILSTPSRLRVTPPPPVANQYFGVLQLLAAKPTAYSPTSERAQHVSLSLVSS